MPVTDSALIAQLTELFYNELTVEEIQAASGHIPWMINNLDFCMEILERKEVKDLPMKSTSSVIMEQETPRESQVNDSPVAQKSKKAKRGTKGRKSIAARKDEGDILSLAMQACNVIDQMVPEAEPKKEKKERTMDNINYKLLFKDIFAEASNEQIKEISDTQTQAEARASSVIRTKNRKRKRIASLSPTPDAGTRMASRNKNKF